MGYDLERFVGYVNEGLLCCVCRDVLQRPLQAPCEHAYCSACISSWLLHHHSCPEDRQPLDVSSLKPLYRYMRNDLSRLQVRCVNAGRGCEVICSLESLHSHEDECEFAFMSCSNTGCPVQVERRGLEAHLSECNFRSRECPNGCGHALLSVDQSQHNCVAELRTEVELLRAEMLCKVEEVRREMESRLDSQRRHMVQKESQLKSEVEELKGQVSRLMCDMRALLAAERLRRQELAEAELEKRELLELLRDLQPSRTRPGEDPPYRDLQPSRTQPGRTQPGEDPPYRDLQPSRTRPGEDPPSRELLELLRDLQPSRTQPGEDPPSREQQWAEQQHRAEQHRAEQHRVEQQWAELQSWEAGLTSHASSLSLHSASHPPGPPPSPHPGDAARRGTRSLDCIKRKSREVTVI